jgi:peroxiredoxin
VSHRSTITRGRNFSVSAAKNRSEFSFDKDGKINKIWRGNAWKPDEVIEAIKQHGH